MKVIQTLGPPSTTPLLKKPKNGISTMFPKRIFGPSLTSRAFIRDFSYYTFATLTWIPAVIFFNGHVGECTSIVGASMYPFLNTDYNNNRSKDLCWINKWSPYKDLQRGMIVSFRYIHLSSSSMPSPTDKHAEVQITPKSSQQSE